MAPPTPRHNKNLLLVLEEFGFQAPIEKTDNKTATGSEFDLPSLVTVAVIGSLYMVIILHMYKFLQGTLKGTVRAKDQDEKEALCARVDLPIKK